MTNENLNFCSSSWSGYPSSDQDNGGHNFRSVPSHSGPTSKGRPPPASPAVSSSVVEERHQRGTARTHAGMDAGRAWSPGAPGPRLGGGLAQGLVRRELGARCRYSDYVGCFAYEGVCQASVDVNYTGLPALPLALAYNKVGMAGGRRAGRSRYGFTTSYGGGKQLRCTAGPLGSPAPGLVMTAGTIATSVPVDVDHGCVCRSWTTACCWPWRGRRATSPS